MDSDADPREGRPTLRITFAALLPLSAGAPDRCRSLAQILAWPGAAKWWHLRGFSLLTDPAATVAHIQWKELCRRVLRGAVVEAPLHTAVLTDPLTGSRLCFGTTCLHRDREVIIAFGIREWASVVWAADVETARGLRDSMRRWAQEDADVQRLLDGSTPQEELRALAAVGGWLADYMHTILAVAQGSKPSIKFFAVGNTAYRDLATEVLGSKVQKRSANVKGNILEALCWHAFEKGKYCLVLGIVWNATHLGKKFSEALQPFLHFFQALPQSGSLAAWLQPSGDASAAAPGSASAATPSSANAAAARPASLTAWLQPSGDASAAAPGSANAAAARLASLAAWLQPSGDASVAAPGSASAAAPRSANAAAARPASLAAWLQPSGDASAAQHQALPVQQHQALPPRGRLRSDRPLCGTLWQ